MSSKWKGAFIAASISIAVGLFLMLTSFFALGMNINNMTARIGFDGVYVGEGVWGTPTISLEGPNAPEIPDVPDAPDVPNAPDAPDAPSKS